MTREEAKELLPVIEAYSEGKEIQFKNKFLEYEDWKDALFINETQEYTYRIKPQPKYRPFKSKEECFVEMQKHTPFGWIKKKDNDYSNILKIKEDGVIICLDNELTLTFFQDLFEDYRFGDGSCCGFFEK